MEREIHVLFVGADDVTIEFVKSALSPMQARLLRTTDEFLAFVENRGETNYQVVIAGPMLTDVSIIEIAQSIRGVMQSVPIYFCHKSLEGGFDRKIFTKNGFTDAFLIPFDQDTFRVVLQTAIGNSRQVPSFRSVRVVDITSETKLSFDLHVYLPTNKKYIQYSTAGYAVDKDRIEKLRNCNVGSIFVPLDQMSKFYDYSAERLRSLTSEANGISETERRERLQGSVRDLMTDMFVTSGDASFDAGKQVLADAGEIVKSFLQKGTEADLYARLVGIVGDIGGSYSHLSNVSTIAALFSMATGIGKPDELALAGLFHDLGMSLVPHEIQLKPPAEWTAEEQAEFHRHTEHSVNLLKQRKVNLPASIQNMILQHHERIDAKGFPTGVGGVRFKSDAQILAIADQFDELTRVVPGVHTLKPEEAIQKIQEDGAYQADIVRSLLKIFKPFSKAG